MTGHQMQLCRQMMLKLPPLSLSEGMTMCAYSSRRGFPGLLTAIGGGDSKEKLEDALGNWKTMQQMAMHYSAQDERLSFVAKWVVIMACKQTAKSRASTDAPGAWNFTWGEVPTRCAKFETLRTRAMALAVDIDAAQPTKVITIQLPTVTEGEPPYKVQKATTPATPPSKPATAATSEDASSSSTDSGSSSAEDSDIGEKEENYLHEHLAICKSVMLIAGKNKASRVHMLGAEETKTTGILITWCGKKLSSYTSQIATGDKFIIDTQLPCRACQRSWPDTITSLFHSTDPDEPEAPDQLPDNFKNIDDGLWFKK